jgi:Fe2+ or Zn2+ uptake regulation protein
MDPTEQDTEMSSTTKIRMTRQRKAILEVLRYVDTHPTADEIYRMVRRRMPHVSLGTVYRNLDILSQHGVIKKLEAAGTQRRYDGNVSTHYHVRCVHCGRIADVKVEHIQSIEDQLRVHSDFEIIGHHLDFEGICPDCKSALSPDDKKVAQGAANYHDEDLCVN